MTVPETPPTPPTPQDPAVSPPPRPAQPDPGVAGSVPAAAVDITQHALADAAAHHALKVRLARLEALIGVAGGPPGGGSRLPAWLRRTRGESRIPVGLAVLLVIGLQFAVPRDLAPHPRLLLPVLEVLLFVALTVANPTRITRESTVIRAASLLLVAAASLSITWSALLLVYHLASGSAGGLAAPRLLLDGVVIWLSNVVIFALWYWEFDRGGPAARAHARKPHPDFLFAQMTVPELVSTDWEPGFVDYLYLSFTNATAFSPTDTLPLSRWAKLAMMFQSGVSLATVALVVARAVNIFH